MGKEYKTLLDITRFSPIGYKTLAKS